MRITWIRRHRSRVSGSTLGELCRFLRPAPLPTVGHKHPGSNAADHGDFTAQAAAATAWFDPAADRWQTRHQESLAWLWNDRQSDNQIHVEAADDDYPWPQVTPRSDYKTSGATEIIACRNVLLTAAGRLPVEPVGAKVLCWQ